ncbi:MAG: hypothetical protein K1Y02_05270, partial [Candidatus Hydrogenedentes bacterium]|nr:hypothetical protein [Candidatus Hydrogenedentota bacterium]
MRFSFRTFLSLFVVVFSVFAMVCGSAEGLDAPEARSLGKASSAAQWTWMHGSNSVNAYGSYGTLGESSATTTPGARRGAATWRDATGALWLFGGFGYGASGGTGYLNDLWKFDPASGRWTWIKGSSSINQPGVYGTQGVAATGNRPGGRVDAVTWFDESGRLWLFGGTGYGSTTQHLLNDLWRYDPDSGNWAWMKGRSNAEQAGVYGELGEAGETNTPGSRRGAVSWTDGADVFWIFGGYGIDENSQMGALNDVWKYDCSTGDWTWMKGAKQ